MRLGLPPCRMKSSLNSMAQHGIGCLRISPLQRLRQPARQSLTVKAQLDPRDDGGFGARDPYEGELASNFSDKTLGNSDTAHIIRGPDGLKRFVGLGAKKCAPCEAGKAVKLDEVQMNRLRNQVPGWRISQDAGGSACLRQEWKVKGFVAGLEMFNRIAAVAEAEGHHPDLHLEGYDKVYAELSTHSVGGLTENDFIMAAKINQLDFNDLYAPKKKRLYFV